MRISLREHLLYLGLRMVKRLDRRRPSPTELTPDQIRRILLVSSTAIGDTLMSTPAFRSIRLAYPQARISLLLNAAYVELLEDNVDVDEILLQQRGYRGFFRLTLLLRRWHPDVVCILHGNEPQATPLAYLSGARFIFKLPNTSRFRFLLTNHEEIRTWDDFPHGIDQRLAVARLAGGVQTDRRMTLPVTTEAAEEVRTLAARQGIDARTSLVGLQVGASTPSRRWAPARFVELGRQLLSANPGLHLVITGSLGEKSLATRVAEGLGAPRVWVTAGDLPLRLLPALLQRCQTLVTGDTGPMHVAVAVGTPIVGLFAAADHRRSGPIDELDRHIIIQKWRTCDPCLGKHCPYGEPLCMENISVEEVFSAVQTQIRRSHGALLADGQASA